MAEETEKKDAGVPQDIQKRLDRVDELVTKNRELRSRIKICALGGSAVLLLIVLVFVYRIYALGRDYQLYAKNLKADSLMEAVKNPDTNLPLSAHDSPEIDAAVKHVIAEGRTRIPPAVKKMQKDVTEKHLPEFRGLVLEELESRSGEFQNAGRQMAENLQDHAETHVKDQLFDVMVACLAEAEPQLRETFPEMGDRKMEQILAETRPYFLDKLHEWGEMRVAQFAPVLRVIEQRAQQMTAGKDLSEAERKAMREEVFNEFLEGFIDRVKYELLPGLGEEIAPETVTAEKKGGE